MDKTLGYRKDGTPITQPHGCIYTRAFIHCSQCGSAISNHGGPMLGSVCVKCYADTNKPTPPPSTIRKEWEEPK